MMDMMELVVPQEGQGSPVTFLMTQGVNPVPGMLRLISTHAQPDNNTRPDME
jgi:hypothetical protein